MAFVDFEDVLAQTAGQFELIDRRCRWDLMQAWRQVYARQLHAATGRWKHGRYEWHVFSFNHCRALRGKKALAAYLAERAVPVIVCPESEKRSAGILQSVRLPNFQGCLDDVYVWPADLSWTMAFTHEESIGLGPYFSRREWAEGDRNQGSCAK